MARGLLNSAPAPAPSAHPATPGEPARVLVAPLAASTARMRLLEVSATKMVLLGAWYATPTGWLKRAEVPTRSSA
jgi:hypothetical protein